MILVAWLAWGHFTRLSDAEVYQKLTGTWVADWNSIPGVQSTTTFGPNGGYACRIAGFTNGAIVKLEGKWEVKKGGILDTITNHSPTNFQVMSNASGRIVHLNDRELVTKWNLPNGPHESVARKVTTGAE